MVIKKLKITLANTVDEIIAPCGMLRFIYLPLVVILKYEETPRNVKSKMD